MVHVVTNWPEHKLCVSFCQC